MRHPHAQDTQPHSLVKGGGVGTQRWSIAEIGDAFEARCVHMDWQTKKESFDSNPGSRTTGFRTSDTSYARSGSG